MEQTELGHHPLATATRAVAGLFPPGVATAVFAIRHAPSALPPEEERAIEGAGARRRLEFAAGRACARLAAARLGVRCGAVGMHPDGAPAWPQGIVGAISHSGEYAAAALASPTPGTTTGVGLDLLRLRAFPHGRAPLFCTSSEQDRLATLPDDERSFATQLIFSAKESVQKCVRVFLGRLPSAHEIEIDISRTEGRFSARLDSHPGATCSGAYALAGDCLVTGVTATCDP